MRLTTYSGIFWNWDAKNVRLQLPQKRQKNDVRFFQQIHLILFHCFQALKMKKNETAHFFSFSEPKILNFSKEIFEHGNSAAVILQTSIL